MKNQYYKKDKQVRLIQHYSAINANGYPVAGYKYLVNGSVWAYARQLSQDQIFQAQAYGSNETRLFVLNYRNDLRLYDLVEYKGKYYTVTRLDTTDDYNTELYVYVKDAAAGDTPRQGQIEPADDNGRADQEPVGVGAYYGVHDSPQGVGE